MKLVTRRRPNPHRRTDNFNPHEREARDAGTASVGTIFCQILIHTSVKLVTAKEGGGVQRIFLILIHTSVKLVTRL